VTGATSGLGEEAAAQLAEAGYAKVIVTGRTAAKAETAGRALADRTGRDTFAPLALDLDDRDSIDASVAELALDTPERDEGPCGCGPFGSIPYWHYDLIGTQMS
jgi:NADP-dependent 3-hydroxy acid dehydrogenase YdfG